MALLRGENLGPGCASDQRVAGVSLNGFVTAGLEMVDPLRQVGVAAGDSLVERGRGTRRGL